MSALTEVSDSAWHSYPCTRLSLRVLFDAVTEARLHERIIGGTGDKMCTHSGCKRLISLVEEAEHSYIS